MPNENKKFWEIKNKVNDSGETEGEVLLYATIASSESWFYDTVTPKQFDTDLKALGDVKTINVRINSDGGEIFAGNAIYNMLKRHPANINVYIDGLAASMASVIAMAGDKIIMPQNAIIMIHKPIGGIRGNSNDLRQYADTLDKAEKTLISSYVEKTGNSEEKITELLHAETWMTAQEALDLGFIDEIEDKVSIAASLNDNILNINGKTFDTSNFINFSKISHKFNNQNLTNSNNSNIQNLENSSEILASIKETARNEGIIQERERIKAIEDLNVIGHQDLIFKAKFEQPLSAEKTAYEVIKAEKVFKGQMTNNIMNDALILNNIASTDTSSLKQTSTEKIQDRASKIAEGANKKRK